MTDEYDEPVDTEAPEVVIEDDPTQDMEIDEPEDDA